MTLSCLEEATCVVVQHLSAPLLRAEFFLLGKGMSEELGTECALDRLLEQVIKE